MSVGSSAGRGNRQADRDNAADTRSVNVQFKGTRLWCIAAKAALAAANSTAYFRPMTQHCCSMEVLMNLPSPEEILRRAEEAKAKATAALAIQQQAPQS
jgi:hypothetical protein